MIKIFLKKNFNKKPQKQKGKFLLPEKKTFHSELNINKS